MEKTTTTEVGTCTESAHLLEIERFRDHLSGL